MFPPSVSQSVSLNSNSLSHSPLFSSLLILNTAPLFCLFTPPHSPLPSVRPSVRPSATFLSGLTDELLLLLAPLHCTPSSLNFPAIAVRSSLPPSVRPPTAAFDSHSGAATAPRSYTECGRDCLTLYRMQDFERGNSEARWSSIGLLMYNDSNE